MRHDDDIDEAIATLPRRLRAARLARGYNSRERFANKCGVTFSTYMSHELSRNQLRLRYVLLYCKVLDISLEWLLLGRDHPLAHHKETSREADAFIEHVYDVEARLKAESENAKEKTLF